jgi:predicted phosphohydrolase
MRRIAWLTDLHLNYIPPQQSSAFLDALNALPVDVVLLGGDISESTRLLLDLSEIAARVRKPVYFVLGSSDYYRSSIGAVRYHVGQLTARMPNLTWMSCSPAIELSPQTALVGHDGWGDATLGQFEDAIPLDEELQIEDLTTYDRHTLLLKLRELGLDAAAHLQQVLTEALERYENVCLLTHVPPFREACWKDGAIAEDNIIPRFTCGAVGGVVHQLMASYPQRRLTVLCGRTHSPGSAQILPNLQVWTGSPSCGRPQASQLFWVP